MHDSLHINRDLPLNAAELPAGDFCIDQPVHSLEPREDRLFVRQFLTTMTFWSSVLTLALLCGGYAFIPPPLCYWVPPGVILVITFWCFQLARHAITLWTALPVDLSTSRSLRKRLTNSAGLLCLCPLASVAFLFPLNRPEVSGLILCCWILVVAVCWLRRPLLTIRAYLTAIGSFLTYNRVGSNSPGLLPSPAGRCKTRQASLAATLLVSSTFVPALMQTGLTPSAELSRTVLSIPDSPAEDTQLTDNHHHVAEIVPAAVVTVVLLALSGPMLTLTAGFLLTAPVLAAALHIRLQSGEDDATWWSRTCERMRASTYEVVTSAILLGWHTFDGSPVMVLLKAFSEHGLWTGPTGSGKTTHMFQTGCQLVLAEPSTMVLINMKGKELTMLAALFQLAEEARQRHGMEIPLFIYTNISGLPVNAFNPCDQSNREQLDLDQFIDTLLNAANLSYGRGYGAGHYSTANEYVLRRAVDCMPQFRSFRDLHQASMLDRPSRGLASTRQLREHGADVLAVLEKLSAIEAFNVTPDGSYTVQQTSSRIDFSRTENLFTRPEIHYFHFGVDYGPELAALQANMVLHTLFGAGATEQHRRKVHVWCAIDEIQELLQRQLGRFYRLARSSGVGLLATTQSEANLKDGGLDLRDVVLDNSCIHFRAGIHNDEEQLRVVRTSGEVLDHKVSRSISVGNDGRTSHSISLQEDRDARLNQNIVKGASARDKHAILSVKRNVGLACYDGQPVVIQTRYDITKDQFEERESFAWPEAGSEHVIQRSGLTAAPAAPSPPVPDTLIPGTDSERVTGPDTPQAESDPTPPTDLTNIFEQLAAEQKKKRNRQKRRGRGKRKDNK